GLATDTAAYDFGEQVEAAKPVGEPERQRNRGLMAATRKARLERHAVDADAAVARLQQNARDAGLASADGGEAGCRASAGGRRGCAVPHAACSSLVRCCFWALSEARNCAACGCSGPAYTLSFLSILRPRAVCGSMPRTVCLMTRSGCLAS